MRQMDRLSSKLFNCVLESCAKYNVKKKVYWLMKNLFTLFVLEMKSCVLINLQNYLYIVNN